MLNINQVLQVALQNHKANRLPEAEQLYLHILEQDPEQPDALCGLGVLLGQLGLYQKAENLLGKAIGSQPESFKVWFSLGNLYHSSGKLSEAVEAYQQAIILQPDSIVSYNNLAYTLQQQSKWDEAIVCYRKILEIDPNSTEAEINIGNVLYAQGKLSPEKQAHYAVSNNSLGVSQREAGNLKAAVEYCRQAIAMQPALVEGHYNLGLSLQEQGEWEEASTCYQKVIELNPSHQEAYFSLGEIYQAQKHLKEAIEAYQKGLNLVNPHYSRAVEAYQSSTNPPEVPVTPELPQGDVMIGTEKFPAIPPVLEGKRPFWSVIIPVYNRSEHLLKSLSSVLAQWPGEEEMEILVMDNASTPPLFELVNSLGKGIVRYYRNPQNLGLVGNHNAGLILSRGQWIHILHDDDYVLPGFYAQLRQSLENSPESIGAAFTGYENINPQGKVISKGDIFSWYGQERGVLQDWLFRIGVTNPLRPPAIVIRRSTHEKIGGYCSKLTDLNNWELCKRIATFYDCWYEPEILARYRLDWGDFDTQKMSNELFLTGNHAVFLRRAIEVSDRYLPEQYRATITAKARSYNFNYLLDKRIFIPIKAGRLYGAFRMVQEALRIDGSPEAVKRVCAWLAQNEVAPLRNLVTSKLLSDFTSKE